MFCTRTLTAEILTVVQFYLCRSKLLLVEVHLLPLHTFSNAPSSLKKHRVSEYSCSFQLNNYYHVFVNFIIIDRMSKLEKAIFSAGYGCKKAL